MDIYRVPDIHVVQVSSSCFDTNNYNMADIGITMSIHYSAGLYFLFSVIIFFCIMPNEKYGGAPEPI